MRFVSLARVFLLSLQVACNTKPEQQNAMKSQLTVDEKEGDETGSESVPTPSASAKPVIIQSGRHDGQIRYYDTTDITTPALKIDSLEYYEREIQEYLGTGAKLKHWSTGQDLQLEDLDWAEKYAIHISLTMERVNEEKDLILHSDAEEYRVVSVAHEPNSIIRVSRSKVWKPMYAKVSQETLKARHGIPKIVNKGANWKQRSLNVLGDALEYLNEQERSFLKDIVFVRDDVGSSKSQSGLYHFQERNGVIQQSITLYNNAFHGMRHSFCGSISDPKSTAHTVIIHELGHMLAHQPQVHFDRRYSSLVDRYNAKVKRYNQHNDPALAEQLNTMNEKLQRMQKNRIQSPGPIIEAFLEHRTFQEGPTEYGNSSVDEAFAESFALFKLDPEALNRIDPKLYRWFDSGAYLDLLPKG